MKRKTIALLLAALMLTLTACGGRDPVPAGTGPGRMVRRIEIAIHPEDAAFERVYVTQENMNELLTLLRGMETDVRPETEPDIASIPNISTANPRRIIPVSFFFAFLKNM